jgi:hypothetical protein
MNSYAAPGTRRSHAPEAILRREEAGGKNQFVGLGEGAARARPAEGKGAVLIRAASYTKRPARRDVAEASGNDCQATTTANCCCAKPTRAFARTRITPELSRPARKPAWKIEATKRVRLE